ncbi:hypothetical protein IWW36_000627 [Coemansia brasiliensis]|uniref:Inner centromere protein ARK-binding domain-containing protein n=1 Tax=Coemansia brasiliensis TaxID=2650707 RepID=A0A9W8IJC6_9FUNG|nr:hypothetical protein IWW36_000627 [Coemansia brasiliensis]
MATVSQAYGYANSTVRSTASDQTNVSEQSTGGSWVGGRKRDWENAFLTKFSDLEATLQENDRWLALYWDNISGMKGTKRPSMAITAALKTSSAKRRARSRIDIRDVFAGSMRNAAAGRSGQLSPLVSRFNTSSRKSLRVTRHRSSSISAGTDSLGMAMAHMAMIPPKSPYLTNVAPPVPPLPSTQRQKSNMSLKSQRSKDAVLKMTDGTLNRSNSAAAKTAAAVKRLQAISGSPPKPQDTAKPVESNGPTQLATPPSSANIVSPKAESPQQQQQQQRARFTPVAPVPTLRDMLLSHHYSPQKPAPPPQPARSQSSLAGPQYGNIDRALNSLTLEAQQQQEMRFRVQPSSQSSQQSSPEPPRRTHPRSQSVTSSEGEHEMTKSEEDVREGLQRVQLELDSVTEQAENTEDLDALCRDIDEVESMLPPSQPESQAGDSSTSDQEESQHDTGKRFVDVEIDQKPISLSLNSTAGTSSESVAADVSAKRKHSDEETSQPQPSAGMATAGRAAVGRGRGRGKPRAGLQAAASGIPRQAMGRGKANLKIPPRNDSRLNSSSGGIRKLANPPKARINAPSATGIRVAEARRKFESPVLSHAAVSTQPSTAGKQQGKPQFISPVAAMRPGYSSIVQTPAAMAAHPAAGSTQVKRGIAQPRAAAPKPMQKSSTAAMREAARKAASARKPPGQSQPPSQRSGNEALFKSVAPRGSQTSLRSQPSREQLQQSKTQPKPPSRNSSSTELHQSAIPIPSSMAKAKHKQAATAAEENEDASSTDAGRWGISSMLSMLSPSSWKSQTALTPETPTAAPNAHVDGVRSPYDLHSPQNPYKPRPEHGGGQGQLVMPKYQDVSVPLRRSSGRLSDRSQDSVEQADSYESASEAVDIGVPHHQRLIQVKENGRISGASSIGSSFFDDESASGTLRKRSFNMGRTQSTPDLPRQLQAEQSAMQTPMAGGLRRKSSTRSNEYTSIIPAGSNSPPEIESDYSDEYSDEEFTPTVKRKKNDFKIPKWATTPELLRGLEDQSRVNPDRIFGKVKPIRVNEIFNRPEDKDARRKPRNSSMIWDGNDALTADDELEYIRRMGFDS